MLNEFVVLPVNRLMWLVNVLQLEIHQNATHYSYIVDVSVADRIIGCVLTNF